MTTKKDTKDLPFVLIYHALECWDMNEERQAIYIDRLIRYGSPLLHDDEIDELTKNQVRQALRKWAPRYGYPQTVMAPR